MAIYVQREGSGIVPQVLLNRFDIVSRLNRENCKTVAKLVEAENEVILVEVENRTWYMFYNFKGEGLTI